MPTGACCRCTIRPAATWAWAGRAPWTPAPPAHRASSSCQYEYFRAASSNGPIPQYLQKVSIDVPVMPLEQGCQTAWIAGGNPSNELLVSNCLHRFVSAMPITTRGIRKRYRVLQSIAGAAPGDSVALHEIWLTGKLEEPFNGETVVVTLPTGGLTLAVPGTGRASNVRRAWRGS